jgi:hypothetical protein
MKLNAKDGAATVLTALAVIVFAASAAEWDVWLVGSSTRWAAAVMLLLGMLTCALGRPGAMAGEDRDAPTTTLAVLGVVALLSAAWAFVAGSTAALAVLVVCDVALWLGATVRHATGHGAAHPV